MKLKKILACLLLCAVTAFSLSACKKGGDSPANTEAVVLADGDLIAVISVEGFGEIKAKLFPDVAPTGVENFRLLAEQGYYTGKKIHRVISDFMLQGGSLNGDGTGGDAAVNGGSFGLETSAKARHYYGALCYANAMATNSTQFYIVNNNEPQNLDEFDVEAYENYAQQFEEAAKSYKDVMPEYAEYYSFQANYYRTTAEAIKSAGDDVKEKYKQVGGTPFLDGNYTVFGQVYEGFDVIESISAVEVQAQSEGNDELSKPVTDIIISSVTVTEYKSE